MGLFDKKIKCSYCNKSVKESYAIDVGICPHCSKRLILNNTNPHDCLHSDGTSHSINNYTSNYNSFETTNNTYNSASTSSSYNRPQNTQTKPAPNSQNRRPTIDPAYIRRINEESNSEHNDYTRGNSNITFNRGKKNPHSKVVVIVIIIFFIANFILPIAAAFIGILFTMNSDDSNDISEMIFDEEHYVDYEKQGDEMYAYNEDGTTYRFPSSSIMTTVLSHYFGKPVSDINYDDLCSIKGVSILCDTVNRTYNVYLYSSDGPDYSDCIENYTVDTEKVLDFSTGGEVSLITSNFYEYADTAFCDLECFPNLEYLYTDYEFIYEERLSNLAFLECVIAPNASLCKQDSCTFNSLKYLSVASITDDFDVNKLRFLESLHIGFYCSDIDTLITNCTGIKSLSVGLSVDTSTINKLYNLEYLEVSDLDNLENLTMGPYLKGLKLNDTDLTSISSITKFANLKELALVDNDSITDYSPIGELKKLNSLTLHIPEDKENVILPKSNNLSSVTLLNLKNVNDTDFYKYLNNVKTLELFYFTLDDTYNIMYTINGIETLLLDHTYINGRVWSLSFLSNKQNLKNLTIQNSYMQFDATGIFITDNIQNLVIDYCEFYVNGYKIKDNYSYKNISIIDSAFIDSYYNSQGKLETVDCSIADLAYYMDKFKNLNSLDMSGCNLSSTPNTNAENVKY